MIVRLRIFGALQQYLGGSQLEVELPEGATLRDLLHVIDTRWGETLPPQFWNTEARHFRGSVLIMSRNADVENSDLLLSDQQEISLLVPTVGG